ncbi:hypothetical protein ACFY41_29570 [Streptomyces syringium]|uniref:hypothetical protein n=1 Tax=Streptomyces syringium TaxID=76729 RepID=UPI003677C36C
MLTHAAAGLALPDDVGMAPANYGVLVETRKPDGKRYTLLRLGPYTQAGHAARDADRLTSVLQGRAASVVPGFAVTARNAPFDVSDHERFIAPDDADAVALLAAAVEGVSA